MTEDELVRAKAEALDDIIEAVVSDGSGDCLWCGGRLDYASCGRPGHEGCMGYENTGDHAPDCIFLPFI